MKEIIRYDFQAAQIHRTRLAALYSYMKHHFEDNGTWSWWLKGQIEELDQEMAEADKAIKAKMTTVGSSGHPVLQNGNLVTPIVPHWRSNEQDSILH